MTQARRISADTQQQRIVIFTAKQITWLSSVSEHYSHVDTLEPSHNLVQFINRYKAGLVIIDEASLDDEAIPLVSELRKRFLSLVIMVVIDHDNAEHIQSLYDVGADDVIDTRTQADSISTRISLLIRQKAKHQQLLRQSSRLHSINLISQGFYSTASPQALIEEALNRLCFQLGFYGAAIVFAENGQYHLYAQSQDFDADTPIYDSMTLMRRFDPLRYVADSGISMVFQDVSMHPHYSAIQGLDRAKAAMVQVVSMMAPTISVGYWMHGHSASA